jgi:hypothetical protein
MVEPLTYSILLPMWSEVSAQLAYVAGITAACYSVAEPVAMEW